MPLVDIALLIIIAGFIFFGLFFGFIHTLGSLVGTVVGIFAASRLLNPVMEKVGFIFGGGWIAQIVWFIILFLVASRLVGLVFWILDKLFGFIKHVPFAKSINRLLGAVLGFVEGAIVVGVIIYFALLVLPDNWLRTWLEGSTVASYLVDTMQALQVFFPEEYRLVE